MRRSILSLVIAALVVTACESSPPTAAVASAEAVFTKAGTTKTNEWIDVPGLPVVDPCSGEAMLLFGKVHVHTTIIDPGDNTFELRLHANYGGLKGIGETTGLKYHIVASGKQVTVITPTINESEVKQQVQLVSQGSADNFKSHVTFVFGVDANGEPYNVVVSDRTSCH